MHKYKSFVLSYERKINILPLRSRIILFATVLMLVYYLWELLVFNCIFGSQEKVADNINLTKKQIIQLSNQINTVAETIRLHPKLELSQRITLLQQEKQQYIDNLSALTTQLIPPKEMAKLLADVLQYNKDILLVKLENIPEEPIFKAADNTKAINNEKTEVGATSVVKDKVQIYKHGLKIEFIGSYFAAQNFLQQLEKLKWKILWEELRYEVTNYPTASIKILVYTLSLQKNYLGT